MVNHAFQGLYWLGIETGFPYGRRLLRMAKITGHGLKLDKVKQTFSSFNAMPAKITEKKIYG